MKNSFKVSNKFKLSPSVLLLVLFIVISILGFQTSKKYIQASRLGEDLNVTSSAVINGGVKSAKLIIGNPQPDYSLVLNVASGGSLNGLASYTFTPSYSDPRNAVTVGYVNQRIANYLTNR